MPANLMAWRIWLTLIIADYSFWTNNYYVVLYISAPADYFMIDEKFHLNGQKAMEEYDLYINEKKPSVGLYVLKGAGLPDIVDKENWIFDGVAAQDLLPPDVVKGVKANGHAFRNMN